MPGVFENQAGNDALSVSELTDALRSCLEQNFPYVWVRGEVTNLSRPASGHCYFSLKDAGAILNCVWFRGQQRQKKESFDPQTGEIIAGQTLASDLENGQECLCAGRISVYAQNGRYQLIVEFVRPAGAGSLAQAFEERKRKLAAAGFFGQERKRKLPWNPERVALVTSPGGAAIHDFLELASDRGSGAEIRLYPTLVQGREAGPDIVRAIRTINSQGWAQVIVLIRGGGSLEDLWCFNEENVAEAVYKSAIPVLAGIGHEVDFTLADLTADLRAATPSHAAQLLWPPRSDFVQAVDDTSLRLQRAIEKLLEKKAASLAIQERALAWFSPQRKIMRLEEKCLACRKELDRVARQWLGGKENRLALLMPALAALDPLGPLERGYAMITRAGKVVQSVAGTRAGDLLDIRLADGTIAANVSKVLPGREKLLAAD